MNRKFQIIVDFSFPPDRALSDFIVAVEHEMAKLMEDYGDDQGTVETKDITWTQEKK